MARTPVGIIGTGMVGQRFLQALDGHPQFEVVEYVGRSTVGRPADQNWVLPEPAPRGLGDLTITDAVKDAEVVFSALPAAAARELEPKLAEQGHHVFTNASAHRMHPKVPLLIGDVNPDHLQLVEQQSTWDGLLVANPNCSAIVATLALAPLQRAWGIGEADIVTLQALSGAGYPGVSSLDATGNVIPYIGNEEDKIETEPNRMLGHYDADAGVIRPASFPIRATATRVPVVEGHTICAHLTLDEAPEDLDAVIDVLEAEPPEAARGLPTQPDRPVRVTAHEDGPQPRRDAMAGDGMVATVGRLRLDGQRLRLVVHASNTVRGAAGASVLNAELAHRQGLLG